jgi:hypothetical protein
MFQKSLDKLALYRLGCRDSLARRQRQHRESQELTLCINILSASLERSKPGFGGDSIDERSLASPLG